MTSKIRQLKNEIKNLGPDIHIYQNCLKNNLAQFNQFKPEFLNFPARLSRPKKVALAVGTLLLTRKIWVKMLFHSAKNIKTKTASYLSNIPRMAFSAARAFLINYLIK